MKIGDFVMGKDESYERSVYEIVDFVGAKFIVVVFRQFKNQNAKIDQNQDIFMSEKEQYRIMSDFEVSSRGIFVDDHFAFDSKIQALAKNVVDRRKKEGMKI